MMPLAAALIGAFSFQGPHQAYGLACVLGDLHIVTLQEGSDVAVPQFLKVLQERFQESGHRNIRALLEGHDMEVPKNSSKPVCLVWALKGECSNQCRRKGQHVCYGRSTIQSIHCMLDECGVDSPQA